MHKDAIWDNTPSTRPIIQSALRKAMLSCFETPPQPHVFEQQPAQSDIATFDDDILSKSLAELRGLPEYKPLPELTDFSWETSESKKHFDEFCTEIAPLLTAVSDDATDVGEGEREDDIMWAAQERAYVGGVLRRLHAQQARKKAGLLGGLFAQKVRVRPEHAAEMARAKVAAAEAAAVMEEAESVGEVGGEDGGKWERRRREMVAKGENRKRVSFTKETNFIER